MTRPTVNLLSGPVEIRREKNKTVIRDDSAGYYRELGWHELTILLRQAADANYLWSACEGKIPKRD
jgi:hypothetical protein